MTQAREDMWALGDVYETYVGRWSRLVAREFLAWLAVPAGQRWLDVGCGSGALSQSILRHAHPQSLVGIDPSEGFLAHARRSTDDARAEFRIGDARALPLPDGVVDAVGSGLVLNFVPDMAKAVAEMARVTRPGGTIGVYVWDYAGKMQLMRHFWDAAAAIDPRVDLDEGRRFPICQPEPLAALLTQAGLHEVAVRAIDVPTVFKDFDDYWTPFLGGQGVAPAYCMSLSDDRRTALRDRIRATLPMAADGSISLIARAWAVRATASGPA